MVRDVSLEFASDIPSVIARRDGRIGRITLNRPRTLNALDLGMIRAFARALSDWSGHPAVHAVVVDGAGGRAFCAGGDIKGVRAHALGGETGAVETFFAEEFALNGMIAAYPKPYIALIDGVCMGGGIGLSVHGAACVTTEFGLFAMPETAIGYFPDVGTTYILPRLPGAIGYYLGLTGTRLHGADAVHAGLATHFVPRGRLSALSEALAQDGASVLPAFAEKLPDFSLAPQRDAIDRCFAAETVQQVVYRLGQETGGWAEQTREELGRMSPASLCWSFEMIKLGAERSLHDCLRAELVLTRSVCRHPDFLEGVRAVVVDKDRRPSWSPARLDEVDRKQIAAFVSGTRSPAPAPATRE